MSAGRTSLALSLLGTAALLVGCGDSQPTVSDRDAGLIIIGDDPTQIPLRGITEEQLQRHNEGDTYFEQTFLESDGLGPLYIRQSCGSCHGADSKGPGATRKMVMVEADGVTPAGDQSALPWGHTVRPQLAAGATTGATPPDRSDVLVTSRLGPAVFGRGWMEAILDLEIERVEAEQAQRTDEIKGRINRVCRESEANSDTSYHQFQKGQCNLIGRFGVKARIASIDDFVADAFQGDMGITSPLRPTELSNPDNLTDDAKPGVDTTERIVNLVADYVRTLDTPKRRDATERGRELFAEAKCAVCHVPSMKTRPDYPIKPLANRDALIYSDLLLHDMGKELADGQVEGVATGREWRTAPLIGLRHLKTYLHDGRARTLEQAILLHDGDGSQGKSSVAAFRALSVEDKRALLDFLGTL